MSTGTLAEVGEIEPPAPTVVLIKNVEAGGELSSGVVGIDVLESEPPPQANSVNADVVTIILGSKRCIQLQ